MDAAFYGEISHKFGNPKLFLRIGIRNLLRAVTAQPVGDCRCAAAKAAI
jgi:hypothetical protein